MSEYLNKPLETNKEKVENSLEKIWELTGEFQVYLKDLGLNVIDYSFSKELFLSETAVVGIPVVRDGLDGVRISFSNSAFKKYGIERDGKFNLNLWFTNEFSDPNNEVRQKIQSKWDELINKYFY